MNITLRRALVGDAIFETACALIFVVGANTLASWTDWDVPALFVVFGAVLGAVAALLYWMATRVRINLPLARIIAFLNGVFAVGGALALLAFWSSLTDGARWLIAMVAVFVGIFAILEYAGLRALSTVR